MLESVFNKIAGLKACNFIKKKLQHYKIFKTIYSEKYLRATAFVYLKSKLQINNVIYTAAKNFQF